MHSLGNRHNCPRCVSTNCIKHCLTKSCTWKACQKCKNGKGTVIFDTAKPRYFVSKEYA